jgi:hypothetical protein
LILYVRYVFLFFGIVKKLQLVLNKVPDIIYHIFNMSITTNIVPNTNILALYYSFRWAMPTAVVLRPFWAG